MYAVSQATETLKPLKHSIVPGKGMRGSKNSREIHFHQLSDNRQTIQRE